jgi:hypothetical protein
MRFILALLLVLSVPSYAQTQPFELQMPVTCGDSRTILNGLKERYSEEVVMMSSSYNENGEQLYHALWVNIENQTWSFVVVNEDRGATCILASGDNFNMVFPGKTF